MNNIQTGLIIHGGKIYCGLKPSTEYGNRLQCFRKGVAIGRTISRQQIVQQIQKGGIGFLKDELHLDGLSKDLIRSIAVRLTNTPQSISRYSRMTRGELIQALVDRGFHR